MRKYVLLLALSAPASQEAVPDIVAFEEVWNPFLRKLGGCPLKEILISPSQCKISIGYWDYALFLKSRKRAAKLFKLKEEE